MKKKKILCVMWPSQLVHTDIVDDLKVYKLICMV